MNITRENLSELEYLVKVEFVEADYQEAVGEKLKSYRRSANIPGFRKGMVPMSIVERMFKTSVVIDIISEKLNEAIYNYIGEEKLNILGTPMANPEKTGTVDYGHQKDFCFYFNIAVSPEFEIDWSKVDVAYNQVKVSAKDVDTEIENRREMYGKFESPEVIAETDTVYGKSVELDKNGEPKEDGMNVFVSLNLEKFKDTESVNLFVGKKVNDEVVFNPSKCLPTAEIERLFKLDNAAAKKFKTDVKVSITGVSRITMHEVDQELFDRCFPGKGIKDEDGFRKEIQKMIEGRYEKQCNYHYVNQVHKKLVELFDAPIPEEFLRKWFASRQDDEKKEVITDEEWKDGYLPGLKWELIMNKLEKIRPLDPTNDQLVERVKEVLRSYSGESPENGNTEELEKSLDETARSIVADRKNVADIEEALFAENLASLFKELAKPTVEKVSAKEFAERVSASSKPSAE